MVCTLSTHRPCLPGDVRVGEYSALPMRGDAFNWVKSWSIVKWIRVWLSSPGLSCDGAWHITLCRSGSCWETGSHELWSSFIFFYYLFVPVFVFLSLSSLHQCHSTRMRKTKKEQKNTSHFKIQITSHFPPTSTSQNNAPLTPKNYTNLWDSSAIYFIQIDEELMNIECMRRRIV